MKLVMKLEGLVNGLSTPFDGEYLKEYDPVEGILETTGDKEEAMVFDGMEEFHACWTQIDESDPVRLDGRPNRPLTAWSVSTESYDG